MGALGRFLDDSVRADLVDELLRSELQLLIVCPVVGLRKLLRRRLQFLRFGVLRFRMLRDGEFGLVRAGEQLWLVRMLELRLMWMLRIVRMLELWLVRQLRLLRIRVLRELRLRVLWFLWMQFVQRVRTGAVLRLVRELRQRELRTGLCRRIVQRRVVCGGCVRNGQLCRRCSGVEAQQQPANPGQQPFSGLATRDRSRLRSAEPCPRS
ncbi:MAG: hypothetical protein IT428_09865 [Planctomycetaceae bacterium]|nr:hypothetical protein [Planctomycetaceae bacterium]